MRQAFAGASNREVFAIRVARWRVLEFAIAAALSCAAATLAAQPLPMLLGNQPASGVARPSVITPATPRALTRERSVVVDLDYLDPESAKAAHELGAMLFDGQVVTLDRIRIDRRGPGNYTWHGQVRGYPRSEVLLTVVAGQIAGSIVVADEGIRKSETYQLLSAGGAQTLRQLDPTGFPPDHPPGAQNRLVVPGYAAASRATTLDQQSASAVEDVNATADAAATIDVMIVYSNQAAVAGAAIGAEIQQAVDRTNLAYANSGIAARLRLVHYHHVSYDESGDFALDLDRLTNGSDGYLDEVAALRDRYGADIVSLFVENSNYCGLGWINSDTGSAFTVVSRTCASSNLSLAHELGHNFGARHDMQTDSANKPYAYGHGYVYGPGLWRTVMAYDSAAVSCARIAWFSNPNLTYGSPPMPLGTASASDVARVHNERAFTLANFRHATTAAAPSSCVATVTPSSLPPAGGVVAVTAVCADGGTPTSWSWTRNAGPLYASTADFSDALPANVGATTMGYTYAGMACNGDSCAPAVKATINVNHLPTTSVPVVEFYNASLDHYFITWVADEIARLDAGTAIKGWTRTGKSFSTYVLPKSGASPVCRYYLAPPAGDTHFFGRGTEECNAVGRANQGFALEDAGFMYMFLPASGACPADTVRVYRVFSNRADVNHRYMIDDAVRADMVAKGWLAEGDGADLVVMCAPR